MKSSATPAVVGRSARRGAVRPLSAVMMAVGLLAGLLPAAARADIVVLGANSCETWSTERAKGPSGAAWERPWLIGYLSGVARGSDIDYMKGVDPEKLLAWIDRYCKENPQKNLGEAAEELAHNLVRAMQVK